MNIVWSEPRWIVPCALAFAFIAALLAWVYSRKTTAPAWVRVCAPVLKGCGFAALLLCLLEPLTAKSRGKPGENLFVCLLDNSKSMQINRRGESFRAAFAPAAGGWQGALEKLFGVQRYLFDAHLQRVPDFTSASFDGRLSSLGSALKDVADRYHNRQLAGVLLFTDGNATDLADTLPNLAGSPPVYPVLAGADAPVSDIAVSRVNVSQTAFEDAPVNIDATIRAVGQSGSTVEVKLMDAAGKQIERQMQRIGSADQTVSARFNIRPEKTGPAFYRIEAAAGANEATLENNARLFSVNRAGDLHRILYVAGRPNWEHKFLQRALAEDPQIKMVSLIRIARREPKFDWRARGGESVNPLYRGFGAAADEAEHYDQPVIVRLNTRDENELRGGFPKTAEELYQYHAVVLDDVEAEFFTREQMQLLQRFVAERGGSLMMLGGQESFRQGAYLRTPIGEMLPVYLDGEAPAAAPGNLRLALTREGWLQPWARLRAREEDEKKRLNEMPAFRVLNALKNVKPGASVIASVSDDRGQEFPALAVQRFGDGRVAAVTVGDLWRWGLRDADSRLDMNKAWRQLARWLVADVPARVELRVEQSADAPDQSVVLKVRVRNKTYEPVEKAAVRLRVQTPSGKPIELLTEPDAKTPGVYSATFRSDETGGYLAQATAEGMEESETPRAETGWVVSPETSEFAALQVNRALLEKIARTTGGEVVSLENLERFVASLPDRHMPVMETVTVPLWHQPAVFLIALACFTGEWALRRWKGMP